MAGGLDGWLTARRYAVPASMVERAGARRLAGDWRGACAAARVDVRFDLDDVRDQVGGEEAALIEADLTRLAPDLVRWHAPRPAEPTFGLFVPNAWITLASYAHARLVVATPAKGTFPQRLRLFCFLDWPLINEGHDWTRARYLWDAEAAPGLLGRMGGGDRTPFFHRDGRPRGRGEVGRPLTEPPALTELVIGMQEAGLALAAWKACGVRVDDRIDEDRLAALKGMAPAAVDAARRALAACDAPDAVVLRTGDGLAGVALRPDGDTLRLDRVQLHESRTLPVLPQVLWQRMPDLELLRAGLISAEELHPLVRSALFPDQPDPGFHPHASHGTAWLADITVECEGERHRLGFRDGRFIPLDHSPDDLLRERTLISLGAPPCACATIADRWCGAAGPELPDELRELGEHTMMLARHGNGEEILRLLDAGLDVRGITDGLVGLLHILARMDGPDGHALPVLARLLSAGLDINADACGRSPLEIAVSSGASDALLVAMVRAGATKRW